MTHAPIRKRSDPLLAVIGKQPFAGIMAAMQPAIARIIDANLNRAREALRVLEDYARFAMNDPAASRELKTLRHGLAAVERSIPPADRLAARDTPGDVGTRITTRSEASRSSVADILTAAAKRLTEALRVLEEYVKLESPRAAARIEALRYRAYEAEKVLVLAARRPRFDRVRLYVLITESLCRRPWLQAAREAIRGGADCLQLREKALDGGELLDRAKRLVALCRRHGVLCIINDRPDIARLAGAHGVHVGQTDLSVADARAIAGPTLLVGKSTHSLPQFRAAMRERPDYLAIGPMFDTSTKPQRHIPGPSILRRLPATDVPVVAIGGITENRVAAVTAAGCGTVAVCSAVISAADPCAAARRIRRALPTSNSRRRSIR